MKKEVCKNCMRYSAYYRQRVSGYEKLSYGLCSVCKEQRKKNEGCEKFEKNELREERQKQSLYFALESAARSIDGIIKIIKEKENFD